LKSLSLIKAAARFIKQQVFAMEGFLNLKFRFEKADDNYDSYLKAIGKFSLRSLRKVH